MRLQDEERVGGEGRKQMNGEEGAENTDREHNSHRGGGKRMEKTHGVEWESTFHVSRPQYT